MKEGEPFMMMCPIIRNTDPVECDRFKVGCWPDMRVC